MQLLLLLSQLTFADSTSSTSVVEPITASSRIDWTRMRVEAIGKASIISNSANYSQSEIMAMSKANESLQDAVFAIELDAQTDYRDLLKRNDEISRHIESTTAKYSVSDVVYIDDDTVEATVFFPLHELFRGYVIERAGVEGRVHKIKNGHTGILIDARDVQFNPVLFPTIQTSTNDKWLSVDGFSKYTAQSKLPFTYATDASQSQVLQTIGSNPAMYIAHQAKFDTLQVQNIDGTILPDAEVQSILANGNIVILLRVPE